MPVFRVRKEPFNWIKTKQKNIELRKGEAKRGETATFLSGKNKPVKAKIIHRQEGTVRELLNSNNFQNIVPTATTLEGAMKYIERIYPCLDGTFTIYQIEVSND